MLYLLVQQPVLLISDKKKKSYHSYTIRDLSQDHIPSDTRALFTQYLNNELTTLGYTVGDDLDININIENFNEGNRALRYWVGFGAGKATSKIVTTLVDKESGKLSVIFKLTVCWQWEYLEEIAKMF